MAIPNVTAYKQYKEIDVHIEKYIVHFSRLSRLDSKKKRLNVCIYVYLLRCTAVEANSQG